jgi:predicted DNA-binding transcriptional regulator AlpA
LSKNDLPPDVIDVIEHALNDHLRGKTALERATMSLPELSRVSGIPRSTIYDLARRDALPTGKVIRFGRRIVVPRVQVERLLSGEAFED